MDVEVEDSGEIQLLSYSVQSPTSQADSAFEDMVNSNQVSLSSTLEDVKDEVISDTPEQVAPSDSPPKVQSSPPDTPEQVTLSESPPKVQSSPPDTEAVVKNGQVKTDFAPIASEFFYQTHSSYVTEVPVTETKMFVRKAQQFSEVVNQPPKMTIRSTSKEMSDEHLQKVDVERKAVISQSMVKRKGITDLPEVPSNGKIHLLSLQVPFFTKRKITLTFLHSIKFDRY
jgi:hypothetical protein